MASGCLILPHRRREVERSFWRCNSAQPMQPGRGEGSRTLLHTQRCSDPELLSCLPTAPIHTEPRCFIQQTAPHPLRTPPQSLGNPLMPPSSLQTLGHIKSTWDLELPAASQHPVQGLFVRMNHSGLWRAEKFIHACAHCSHREQAQKPASVAV